MIIFCSDVHLHTGADHENTFFQFLNSIPATTKAIFILGDLFEYWWNDDHQDVIYESWETYFKNYHIPIYFLKGNRDFLCSNHFFKKTDLILIPSASVLFAYGQKIALYHGDEPGLCDPKYQIARKIMRSGWVQYLYHQLPKKMQLQLAKKARKKSNPPLALSINYEEWIQQQGSIDIIIHGHLHFQHSNKIKNTKIYQLGTWDHEQGSWLSLDLSGFKFHQFHKEISKHHVIK